MTGTQKETQAAVELEAMGRRLQLKKSSPSTRKKPTAVNLARAIARKCNDCSGGSSKEVANCPITSCPLYPFRL